MKLQTNFGSAKFSVSDISKFMFYENCGKKSNVYTGMILLFLHLFFNLFFLESYFINQYYYYYYYPQSIYTLSYIFTLT